MMNQNKKLAFLGLFTAIAIIFGYIESLLPVFAGIPGIKLGLANLSVLIILHHYGWREAALVSSVRIIVVGFLFGSMFSILYSLAGALVSLTVMTIMDKKTSASLFGTSVAGGIAHNIGQLIVACMIVENRALLYYAPVLIISGMITGLVIGYLTSEVIKRVNF